MLDTVSRPIAIAIIGYGKIAKDEHYPSIVATQGLELVATVSRRNEAPGGLPSFSTLTELAQSGITIDAVAVCTPPQERAKLAMAAADYGWDVLLEKPPGLSSQEVLDLSDYIRGTGQILFTTWHAQYNDAVELAAKHLAGQDVISLHIDWREDVRKWHPGQDWIWTEEGFGVFDPGINGLSIATKILPVPLTVEHAVLTIADNHHSPIAADISFGPNMTAHFDWREIGDECWKINIETSHDCLVIDKGGRELWINGDQVAVKQASEYAAIYSHFSALIRARASHIDVAPLALTQAAMRIGERLWVPAFDNG